MEDWKSLTFRTEDEWQKAIDIFLDRIETRYLIHIDRIIKHRTSGFAVLALDCTLIETLEQFRQGKEKTPRTKIGEYFVAFLTSTSFKKHFDKDKAKMFYKQIRCGLLHQTEAKNSRVKRTSTLPMIAYTKGNKGLIVNSKPFHQELKTVIRQYADELRNPKSKKAREAFRAKMNFICGVEKQAPQGFQLANPDPVAGGGSAPLSPPQP
ncbi:MAG TPA: hypothetical protein VFA90_17415 [Terriglobales bacterium]|nr:hypothetical protein [Terriglobales bacterium]